MNRRDGLWCVKVWGNRVSYFCNVREVARGTMNRADTRHDMAWIMKTCQDFLQL